MKPIFDCEINYVASPHLEQIYEGFFKLAQQNIISVTHKHSKANPGKPLLTVNLRIQNRPGTISIIYDTLDGLNWTDSGSSGYNLSYFHENIKADYYFKRSFNSDVSYNAPPNCKVFPLGLNYHIDSDHNFNQLLSQRVKKVLKRAIYKRSNKRLFGSSDYEYPPIAFDETKVLFLTRLWDSKKVNSKELQQERERINHDRIECIKTCKKEFKDRFTGGLQSDEFTLNYAKEFIADDSITRKAAFINNIRSHNICIATTGLHNSIGWKFAEYVSNSRAIISEPLCYQLPGNFNLDINYLEFQNSNDLIEKIHLLLNDIKKLRKMMMQNHIYYNNYLRPDNLVLNTLLTVYNDS